MKESYVEGLATRNDPESCVASREVGLEALTGVWVGQVLSRESTLFGVPTQCPSAVRQHRCFRFREAAPNPARSETLCMSTILSAREPGDLVPARGRWAAGRRGKSKDVRQG